MSHVAAIVTALELLGDGDQDAAVEVLLAALESGPSERPYPCRHNCGGRFEWPGLREAHEFNCAAAGELLEAA